MGPKIYPEVHENPGAFFNSSSPILLEPLSHGSSNWSLPREDCINNTIGRYHKLEDKDQEEKKVRIEKRNKGSQLGVL